MSEDKEVKLQKLKQLADSLGIEYHHVAGIPKLTALIAEHTQPKVQKDESIPPNVLEHKESTHHNTRLQVLEAVQPIIDKKPDFQAIVDDETWTFRYRGREDSGNLAIPLRVIKMKAQTVAQGGRAPASLSDQNGKILMV